MEDTLTVQTSKELTFGGELWGFVSGWSEFSSELESEASDSELDSSSDSSASLLLLCATAEAGGIGGGGLISGCSGDGTEMMGGSGGSGLRTAAVGALLLGGSSVSLSDDTSKSVISDPGMEACGVPKSKRGCSTSLRGVAAIAVRGVGACISFRMSSTSRPSICGVDG